MTEVGHKSMKELCSAALGAKDNDEFSQIVQELNAILQHEEQIRSESWETAKADDAREEIL